MNLPFWNLKILNFLKAKFFVLENLFDGKVNPRNALMLELNILKTNLLKTSFFVCACM